MIGKPSCPVLRGGGRCKLASLPTWVKHGLRIRTFYGTSPNAVRVQLWSAICTYLAIAITRKQLRITTNLTTFVQVLSVHALSKAPIQELFAEVDTSQSHIDTGNQLTFSGL
jgi:hypothetical protein